MANYAAIDLGTNSCRLLIARPEKEMAALARQLETTRLGAGASAAGNLSSAAMDRTIECLLRFKAIMREWQVEKYRAVATCAVREAANGEEFVAQVRHRTGLKIDIIKPEEEARLSYSGAIKGLDLPRSPLVIDLGGGSTEFMLFMEPDHFWTSVPVGAVRATEADLPAVEIIGRVQAALDSKSRFNNNPLVFVGGTATTAVAIKLALAEYRPELVHGQVLTRQEIADIYNLVERMPLHLLQRLPGLQPERADIIGKGLLIVLLIVDYLGKTEITVSESDLLEAMIWEMK